LTAATSSAIDGENGCPIAFETTRSAAKLVAMILSMLAFDDWPSTDMVATNASPIISADAVAAVRRGLRSALSADS